jgi:hypothetical protein
MVKYTIQSRHHVFSHGHAANSKPQAGQSRFLPTEGGQAFTDEVIAAAGPPIIQPNGRLKYQVADLGRAVGYDRHGKLTRGGIVIVEGPNPSPLSTFVADEVVTQYPW